MRTIEQARDVGGVEFLATDGLARLDEVFEEEFGSFDDERMKITAGSDSVGCSESSTSFSFDVVPDVVPEPVDAV